MKGKIIFTAKQIYMACGLLIGVFAALFSKEVMSLGDLGGGFMHAFPAFFSPGSIRSAILLQLCIPVLVALSAWTLFCAPFCTLMLSLRCALDGFVLCMFVRASTYHDAVFFIVFACLLIFEGLSVLCINSMAYQACRFLLLAKSGKAKKAIPRYVLGQCFYCGLIFVLYLARGTTVLLFGE